MAWPGYGTMNEHQQACAKEDTARTPLLTASPGDAATESRLRTLETGLAQAMAALECERAARQDERTARLELERRVAEMAATITQVNGRQAQRTYCTDDGRATLTGNGDGRRISELREPPTIRVESPYYNAKESA